MLRKLLAFTCCVAYAQSSWNLDLVGHAPAAPDVHLGDIAVLGNYVYTGSSDCGKGTRVFDVFDSARPKEVAPLAADKLGQYQAVAALSIRTTAFEGDVVISGIQQCDPRLGGPTGIQLWDMRDPLKPVALAQFSTGKGGVHNLSAKQVGDRAYAYLAVPNSEVQGDGGDFRIVDISDPRNPKQVSDWGIFAGLKFDSTTTKTRGRAVIYCHSTHVSPDGRTAFLTYWDGGIIMLDISDPSKPKFLGKTAFDVPDEGNAHTAFHIPERNLLIEADEDYSIGGATVSADGTALTGVDTTVSPKACTLEQPVEAKLVYVGRGCSADALTGDPRGKIALVDAGGCTYYEKLLKAQQAGAVGAVLSRTPVVNGPAGSVPIRIPGVTLLPADYEKLRTADTVSIGPNDRSWGYVRIWDIIDPAWPKQIGNFATDRTVLCPPVDPDAWYTVHDTVVVGNTLFASWYSDGVRMADITDPFHPREIGYFVPPDRTDDTSFVNGRGSVWGVVVRDGLVYASDENNGLWILRPR